MTNLILVLYKIVYKISRSESSLEWSSTEIFWSTFIIAISLASVIPSTALQIYSLCNEHFIDIYLIGYFSKFSSGPITAQQTNKLSNCLYFMIQEPLFFSKHFCIAFLKHLTLSIKVIVFVICQFLFSLNLALE